MKKIIILMVCLWGLGNGTNYGEGEIHLKLDEADDAG